MENIVMQLRLLYYFALYGEQFALFKLGDDFSFIGVHG